MPERIPSPTIVRTNHRFGDYISPPDQAKFKLSQKASRPWIVNTAMEVEPMKERAKVKEKRNLRKISGTNKKHVKNINDIIENDNKDILNNNNNDGSTKNQNEFTKKSQNGEMDKSKHGEMDKSETGLTDKSETEELTGTNLSYPANCQENDLDMEQRQLSLAKDIELEQQNMVNKMFNNPETNHFIPTLPNLMPLVVPHSGGYHVVLVPFQSIPPPTYYSSFPSSTSTESTASSDDGFEDGEDSLDETCSMEEAFSDKLEIDDCSEEEWCLEEDEKLNRLVMSIIDE